MMMIVILIVILVIAGPWVIRLLFPAPKIDPAQRAAETRRVVEEVKRLAQPALILRAAAGANASHLGGEPSMPSAATWPVGPEGPLGFLGQFDLSEMRIAGGPDWLPCDGFLLAFYDERWGFRDQVRIIHNSGDVGDPLKAPEELPRLWRHPERAVAFESRPSLPSLDWLGVDPRTVEGYGPAWAEITALSDKQELPSPHHQIGGFPAEIQSDWMPVVAEVTDRTGDTLNFDAPTALDIERSASWRLLLQIDSDSALGMNWRGAGAFYVLVREQDAKVGDFSKTVTIPQTY